ncbi:unnamed protein product [Somion occarium]|uniref:RRM domain-containing protein n=1 Tax=Somion occarium TaxID=3059160 RepID=A0ABP1D2V5_9APHY
MSDAPAAPVTENGVPPTAQESPAVEEPGFKVFAGNLAYSTTDEGLKTFFEPVESEILTAQVILRGTRSAGYGFVSLASAEAAQKAVDLLNKKELDGREVIVEIAKPSDQKDKEKKQKRFNKRRPGRRGSKAVPGEVSEAEANGDADKSAAEGAAPSTEEGAKPKKKKNNKRKSKRAKAAAAGEGAEAGEAAATTESGEAIKKRTRKPRAPRPQRPAGEDPAGEPSKSVLFVANLGFTIDDAGLAALFTDADVHVNSARIVRRRWGKPRKSKGYGFVDVGSEEEQKKAIELLQGKDVGGRPIAVKIAVDAQHEEAEAEAKADEAAEAAEAAAAAPVAAPAS